MQEGGNDILILFIASSALIVAIVILAFLFLQSYQKKMVAQKLQLQQTEIDLQQKLLKATIDTQEKERKRIASDLHDDIGLMLSALRLNLKHLKTLEKIGPTEREFLDHTASMLDDGLANVRSVSYNLLPPTLVRFGLWEALEELVKQINKSEQIKVVADFTSVKNLRMKDTTELSIFRVLQELIANTTHHSSASEVVIQCKRTPHLEIEYTDNGKGITDEEQLQGLGMINMQSRIQSINGSISISEVNESPFRATIQIPNIQDQST